MTHLFDYRLTRSAERDLHEVWLYTLETWGEEQGDRYVSGLKGCLMKIERNPAIGKLVNEIGASLRMFRCQHHYMFYVLQNKTVIVVGILHEKMDLLQRLQERIQDSHK